MIGLIVGYGSKVAPNKYYNASIDSIFTQLTQPILIDVLFFMNK